MHLRDNSDVGSGGRLWQEMIDTAQPAQVGVGGATISYAAAHKVEMFLFSDTFLFLFIFIHIGDHL